VAKDSDFCFLRCQPFLYEQHLIRAATAGFFAYWPNSDRGGGLMKALALAGVIVLILGIVSFFVPLPHSEHHGVNVGDAHIGVTTEHDEKVPPALSVVLVVVGAGLIIAGRKA
jgi:hypothetical protein